MNNYYEAPNYPRANEIKDYSRTIFLGGSITGAEDWQKKVTPLLTPHFTVFNPRRKNYDTLIPNAEREQINWEHNALVLCEVILFYFSHETLSPITLFELGKMLEMSKISKYKKIYICIHPEYKRKNDVVIQTEITRPDFARKIKFDLLETMELIIREVNS